jgi:hypothetical protein
MREIGIELFCICSAFPGHGVVCEENVNNQRLHNLRCCDKIV